MESRLILTKFFTKYYLISILEEPCRQCLEQGIFIVGGSNFFSGTNETELIDPFASISQCMNETTLKPFPSSNGRYGMFSSYLGHGSAVFCGGRGNEDNKDFKDCLRY